MPGDSSHINNKAVTQNTYDAIVVGSGISGGWAAKELTEKGLKVLMLERGKDHEHIKDYKTANKDPWEFEHRGHTTAEQNKNYPIIHRGWAANEAIMDSWANEQDCPYTEVKPFTWWRSYQMGGRSILWGRQSYRWSDFDFEAESLDSRPRSHLRRAPANGAPGTQRPGAAGAQGHPTNVAVARALEEDHPGLDRG